MVPQRDARADLFDQLARYHAAGWAVVALHSVTHLSETIVACSCERGADPDHRDQAGKHPVGKGWQTRGLRSWPDIVATWSDRPTAGVGIVTGAPSGVWVLDVDPGAGGIDRLRSLIAEHGELPRTYTVETGSGGWHAYWRMPTDFEPTNSRGRLPVGIDVRGTGGQVVAPPSVSGKGPYRVLVDMAPVDAPAWLLDLIRPRELSAEPVGAFEVSNITLAELPGPERERLAHYARTAVTAELDRLASAPTGTRNDTAFAAACSIYELLNAEWSGLDHGAVWRAFAAAVDRCGLPAGEGLDVWGKAGARIGLRARELPRLPDVAWQAPPFVASSVNGNGAGNLAPAQYVEGVLVEPADPIAAMRARVLDSAGLDLAKPLDPLVHGFLSLDTCAWVIGQPGHGKSFVALDMALSVATGRPWHGARVSPGLVLYVAAEGARGVRARVRAWESRYYEGKTVDRFGIYPDPIQVDGPEWSTFVAMCSIDRPSMIIFDTQARVSTLFDENSNSEMGRFIEAIEGLRRTSGACVLVIHHETKSGGSARGASAILGAAQTELTVTRDRNLIVVRTTKQKDHEPAEPLMLRMEPETGAPAIDGELTTPGTGSIVLVAATGEVPWMAEHPATVRARIMDELQHESDRALVDVMMRVFAETGGEGTRSEIMREYLASGRFKRSTFYTSFGRLRTLNVIGRVAEGSERYRFIPLADREPTPLDEIEVTDE